MAQTTTLILLPHTVGSPTTTAVTGTAQKAAGYYNRNLQTFTWDISNLNAIIKFEASLATTPSSDNDWFELFKIETGGILTQKSFRTIEGNFVWVRCRAYNIASGGVIQSAKVSY